MRPFYELMGVPGTGFDPEHHFVTSWLLPPLVLAVLRITFGLYCLAATFADWGWAGTHRTSTAIGQSFSFFTNLSYWGMSFYLLVAGIHTAVYAVKGYSRLHKWPRLLHALHSLFYTTVVTFPILVTLVFWVVLYKAPWFPIEFKAWSNVSKHGLNSLFALFEIFLTATDPLPWLHLVFEIVILLLYLALAYVTYATQGFYVYSFLNPAHGKGKVAGYCIGIAAAIIVIFLVVRGLIWVRRRFTGAGKKSKRDVMVRDTYDDCAEVTYIAMK